MWDDGTKRNWQEDCRLWTGKLPELLKSHKGLYLGIYMMEMREYSLFFTLTTTTKITLNSVIFCTDCNYSNYD